MNLYLKEDIDRYLHQVKWGKVGEEISEKVFLAIYPRWYRIFERPDKGEATPIIEAEPTLDSFRCYLCLRTCRRIYYERHVNLGIRARHMDGHNIHKLDARKHKCGVFIPLPDNFYYTYPTFQDVKRAVEWYT